MAGSMELGLGSHRFVVPVAPKTVGGIDIGRRQLGIFPSRDGLFTSLPVPRDVAKTKGTWCGAGASFPTIHQIRVECVLRAGKRGSEQ